MFGTKEGFLTSMGSFAPPTAQPRILPRPRGQHILPGMLHKHKYRANLVKKITLLSRLNHASGIIEMNWTSFMSEKQIT